MRQPAVEARGGEHPDWANTRPGKVLPQLPGAEDHDDCGDPAPLAAPLLTPCPEGIAGCGGDLPFAQVQVPSLIQFGMPVIRITKRDGTVLEVLVSPQDYETASSVSWHMRGGNGPVGEYAHSTKFGYLHRWVAKQMGLINDETPGHGRQWQVSIDHENGLKLDCQRHNLRLRTRSQQMLNPNDELLRTNKSGFRGVSFHASHAQSGKPWIADVRVNGKHKTLGGYATAEEAADVRRTWDAQHQVR